MQRVEQDQFTDNDRGTLEVDRLPTVVTQVLDHEHQWVDILRDLGQSPLKVGEERRIVQGPF